MFKQGKKRKAPGTTTIKAVETEQQECEQEQKQSQTNYQEACS